MSVFDHGDTLYQVMIKNGDINAAIKTIEGLIFRDGYQLPIDKSLYLVVNINQREQRLDILYDSKSKSYRSLKEPKDL